MDFQDSLRRWWDYFLTSEQQNQILDAIETDRNGDPILELWEIKTSQNAM